MLLEERMKLARAAGIAPYALSDQIPLPQKKMKINCWLVIIISS